MCFLWFTYNEVYFREQHDARVAEQLADLIEREEEEKRRMLEEEDKELARLLQVTVYILEFCNFKKGKTRLLNLLTGKRTAEN